MRKHHFELVPRILWTGRIDHWYMVPKIQGIKPKTRKQARDLRDRLDRVVTDWQHETIRNTFHKGLCKAFRQVISRPKLSTNLGANIKAYHG